MPTTRQQKYQVASIMVEHAKVHAVLAAAKHCVQARFFCH